MRHFKAFIHTFWLARVSLASLLLAAIALNFVPQAEDLLLDYRGTGNWWFWLLYNLAFFLWALVIYYFARIAIESPHWARARLGEHPTPAEFDALKGCYAVPSRYVPLILGLGCFAIIGYAVWQARANIPATVTIDAGAADLVRQLSLTAWLTLGEAVLFLIVVFVGRLLILRSRRPTRLFTFFPPFQPELAAEFRGAPLAEDGTARDRSPPARRGGRLRRAITTRRIAWAVGTVAIIVFLVTAFAPSYLGYPPRAILLFILLAGWVPIATALVILGYMYRWPVLATALALLALMPVVLGDNHGIAVTRSTAADETPPAPEPAISFKDIADEDRYASRQQAYVEASRAAVADAADTEKRLDIDTWIARWRSANGCEADGPCAVRPILIAASGGASRAAFFTGSALGALLDATCPEWSEDPDGSVENEACADRPALLDQLFAISSVSGSSLTAVLFSRLVALSDGKTVPCAAPGDGARRSDLWHATGSALSWRRCLELLTVGDYLSPTMAALASRDLLPWLFPKDRVKVLETAFSDHIDWVLGEGLIDFDADGFLASYATQLECRDEGCLELPWRPLVISNGSSVRTGERIVTSPIAPTLRKDGADATDTDTTPEDVFRATLDFHELADCPTATCDLSLATAVTNSARFPIVSAHGDILDREGTTVDEIVDGGYFESVGVTSLADIARHLNRHQLHPAVIVITNDPGASRAIVDPAKGAIASDQVIGTTCRESSSSWFDNAFERHLRDNLFETVRLPIEAVLNARGARGVASLEDLEALIAAAAAAQSRETAVVMSEKAGAKLAPTMAIHFGVQRPCNIAGDQMDNISMSWWLSKPVQASLSEQVFNVANFAGAARVCALLQEENTVEACRRYFRGRYLRFFEASRRRAER